MVLPFCFQAPLFYHLLLAFWSLARVRWSVEEVPHEDKTHWVFLSLVLGIGLDLLVLVLPSGRARAGDPRAESLSQSLSAQLVMGSAFPERLNWNEGQRKKRCLPNGYP